MEGEEGRVVGHGDNALAEKAVDDELELAGVVEQGGGGFAHEEAVLGLYRHGRECRRLVSSPGRQILTGGGRNRAAGEVAALAGGGVSWRRFLASRTLVCSGRSQGVGQVALAGSLGSTWPRTHRGRGPPAAYERAAAEQRGERNQGRFCDFHKFRDLSVN